MSHKTNPLTHFSLPRNLGYWLRLVGFFVLAQTVALISLPLLMGAAAMLGLLYAPCHGSQATPADYGYEWEDVTLPARIGGRFQGAFIPGPNGATIIMPPTGSADISARLPEAAMLRQHGYSVFIYESRRCADLGPLSLGYDEVNEIADVLDYLRTHQDVDPERIGIQGFSMAGAMAIMAAARYPALRAVVAEGGYGDFTENAINPGAGRGWRAYFRQLFVWSTRLTYRLVTGFGLEVLSPVSVIGELNSRPVLLIYGSQEPSLAGGRLQEAAGGDNTELWIVPGAGHGNYRQVAPEAYEARVIGFFDRTLGK
jgi:pimeloyl-ACP methyl ester carboxylesterase